jgi:hypothetical protein
MLPAHCAEDLDALFDPGNSILGKPVHSVTST